MERLIRILLELTERGDHGLSAHRLAEVAGYPGDSESGLAALRRDVRRLRQVGWDIAERRGGRPGGPLRPARSGQPDGAVADSG